MQPNDPNPQRPDYQPVERPYTPRPTQPDFTRPSGPPVTVVPGTPIQATAPPRGNINSAPYQAPGTPNPLSQPQQLHSSLQEEIPSNLPPKSAKPSNWLLPVMITIGLAIVIALVVLFLVLRAQNEPNKVFKQAFESTLTTRNIEVQTNAGGSITTTKFEFVGPMAPAVSVSGNLDLNGSSFQLNGYGTLLNTFAEYTELSNSQMDKTDAAALNKWVHLRSQGTLSPGINSSLAVFADPRSSLVGDVVFGNFTNAASTSLTQSLINSKVYTYNVNAVKQIISGGQTYLEYPVRLNIAALKAWNQKIITSMGLSARDIQTGLNNLTVQQSATGVIYINKTTSQLVRFDLKQNGKVTTTLYMQKNDTTLPSQPSTYVSWSQFAPYQNQLEQQAALIQSDASLDAERKADLSQLNRYIQNYYTSYSNYPTLADLNNQVWVSVNMQGINPDVFKDPQGSSLQLSATPTVNSYAYEPLGPNGTGGCNDGTQVKTAIACESYTLITILSSGQQYTLNNLN